MQNSILPSSILRRSLLDKLALSCGWVKRASTNRALSPAIFLRAMVASVASGQRSLRELASEVGLLAGRTISKQGLCGRINASAVEFLMLITAEALRRAAGCAPGLAGQIGGVTRILVGDSSTLALHDSLRAHFPGATNQTGKRSAQLKLQLTFDLLGGRWLHAGLDPYRRNDKSAALDIIGAVLSAGDLIIRDLGYASLRAFREIAGRSAYFLSRLPAVVGAYGPDGGKLDLLALARRRAPRPGDSFTMSVQLGADERYECQLLVVRVPAEVANKRRRRLNAESRRRGQKPHRKAYLELQDWTLLVTNLGEQQVSHRQLEELYRLRWRIENIFKLSKGDAGLAHLARHKTNRHHVQVLIWAWILMMVVLSANGVFRLCSQGGQGVVTASLFRAIKRLLSWLAT